MSNITAAITPAQKEKLLDISDLNAGMIRGMSDKQLQDYVAAMRSSANLFPALKEKLEAAYKANNYALMPQLLKSIRGRLVKMHADSLVGDFDKKINPDQDLETIRYERLGVIIDYLLSTLTMFFAEVQAFLGELDTGSVANKHKSHSKLVKEKLYTVPELDGRLIEKMTDEQLSHYLDCLAAFQDAFGEQEKGLRNAVKMKQYTSVLRWLTSIEESLSKIRVDSLLEDCQNQIRQCKDITAVRHDKLEVFANYFLPSLSMLSADIKKLNLPALKQIVKHILK
jgi:hypothetical protein